MRPLSRSLAYLTRYWRTASGAFVALVMASATGLLMPRVLQAAIDAGVEARDLGAAGQAAAALLTVAAVRGLFAFLQGYWSEAASQHVAFDLRNGIYEKLQRLSFSYHDRAQTGQLMTRVTSDVEIVRQFVGLGFLQLVSALVLLVGSVAILLAMNWRLALAGLSAVLGILVSLSIFVRVIQPMFRQAQAKLGALNTVLEENIAGARLVRAFAAEGSQRQRFARANDELLAIWLRLVRAFAASFPLVFLFANLGTLIVFWLGGNAVIGGTMTVGQLVAFNAYLAMLLVPLFILGGVAGGISRASASAARIFEVIDSPIEVTDRPGAIRLPPIRGEVRFENVRFRYVGSQTEVLKGVSFHVSPGQMVAILGRTGSGKSTIVNLIPRFYDVTGGRITVDGVDVRDVTLESLRCQIGVVLQEPILFSGTIRENIAYGRPEATMAEIEAASRAGQAHEFIVALPEGYDSPVGERGVRLSGGQKQRIAIARALLVNPRILILDDSTSAVDATTEMRLQEALLALLEGRTAFVIAQRISTVLRADKILLLDDGRIAGEGTHSELLASSPLYAEIVCSQLVGDAVWWPGDAALAADQTVPSCAQRSSQDPQSAVTSDRR